MGAATSSHQVEGGNRHNDWWEFEQKGLLPFRSEEACRQYELYERDFDLARGGGHNAHRLSIEWSRVEPVEGDWNEEAIAHYLNVVRALKKRDIEPIVTLHHFTNPAWFARRGGWLRRDSPALFARYTDRVAAELSREVRIWVTVNEPTVYAKRSFVKGEWPPQRTGAWLAGARALRNMCRAHVAAYEVLHRHRSDAFVGLAHSATLVHACRPERRADRRVAALRDLALNGLVFHFIGARRRRTGTPAGSPPLDFVGINYYTRSVVHRAGWGIGAWVGRECEEHVQRGRISDLGWEIHPEGLTEILERFSSFNLPMMITENGIATDDEELRCDFLQAHLEAVKEAVDRGLDVIGYLHWSLIDNFEWSHGTAPHFGLVGLDYQTQERTPRPAFRLFARVCRETRRADEAHLQTPGAP
jgi:beta-glucosidase